MKTIFCCFLLICFVISSYAQKDSLQLGSRYSEDQLYASVSYSQFFDQPSTIFKSYFSYSLSFGFLKDIILNKRGSISIAGGVGYGFDFFNHRLKVTRTSSLTEFSSDNGINNNLFKSHNLEIPFEFRWRSSNANKYSFWRIYTGIKFTYNLRNSFQYNDENSKEFKFSNIEEYRKLQYGATLSVGYDKFTINIFYGLTPIFSNSKINDEAINTKILKMGLIFYIL